MYLNLHKSLNENDEDKYREYELKVRLCEARKLEALTSVAFFNIVVKAPAPFGSAEQKVDE